MAGQQPGAREVRRSYVQKLLCHHVTLLDNSRTPLAPRPRLEPGGTPPFARLRLVEQDARGAPAAPQQARQEGAVRARHVYDAREARPVVVQHGRLGAWGQRCCLRAGWCATHPVGGGQAASRGAALRRNPMQQHEAVRACCRPQSSAGACREAACAFRARAHALACAHHVPHQACDVHVLLIATRQASIAHSGAQAHTE